MIAIIYYGIVTINRFWRGTTILKWEVVLCQVWSCPVAL